MSIRFPPSSAVHFSLRAARQLALESDGSDEAMRKIAEDGAKDLEMRLMG